MCVYDLVFVPFCVFLSETPSEADGLNGDGLDSDPCCLSTLKPSQEAQERATVPFLLKTTNDLSCVCWPDRDLAHRCEVIEVVPTVPGFSLIPGISFSGR